MRLPHRDVSFSLEAFSFYCPFFLSALRPTHFLCLNFFRLYQQSRSCPTVTQTPKTPLNFKSFFAKSQRLAPQKSPVIYLGELPSKRGPPLRIRHCRKCSVFGHDSKHLLLRRAALPNRIERHRCPKKKKKRHTSESAWG